MKPTSILRYITASVCIATTLAISVTTNKDDVEGFFAKSKSQSGHTNNWAVLVCTSRFWFNYRHIANTLSMYRTVKRLGIPDSNIIMMLADDVACNSRNIFPATVYNNRGRHLDLYGENVEVDYRGYEVTVENFIRLLTGRVAKETPRSKRLMTDDQSNILIFMTGHGGEEFLKFQDAEEISAYDLGDAFQQMYEKKRYNEILFMIDTCQANTMYTQIHSPNILATGSSKLNESSYSHHDDPDIGVAVIDRFTYYILEVLEKVNMQSKATLKDLFDTYDYNLLQSTPGVRDDLFDRPLDEVLLTDFFGNVQNVELTESKEVNNSLTEADPALVDSDPMFIEDPQAETTSSLKQSVPWSQEQSHTFEIGNPDQSQAWRFVAFAVLSVAMGGALFAGSSLV
ncbi:peptidase C13 family-domain-containing protein [Linnemannia elongata]|nr:peptidase C13 family-domain-containing protein [Linnemannia elongata]